MSIRALKFVRLGLLLAGYLLLAMWCLPAALATGGPRHEFLLGVSLAFVVSTTCLVDARIVGRGLVCPARAALFVAWPFAMPVYVLWSRGWWGLVVLLILGGAALAVAFSSAIVGVLTSGQV